MRSGPARSFGLRAHAESLPGVTIWLAARAISCSGDSRRLCAPTVPSSSRCCGRARPSLSLPQTVNSMKKFSLTTFAVTKKTKQLKRRPALEVFEDRTLLSFVPLDQVLTQGIVTAGSIPPLSMLNLYSPDITHNLTPTGQFPPGAVLV